MNPDGTGQAQLTNNAAADIDPAWSVDGSKIAFASDRDGKSQIYVMNANGTDQRRITFSVVGDALGDFSPSWSADARRLVFERLVYCVRDTSSGGCAADLYTVDSNGVAESKIATDEEGNFAPAWSPDGGKIAERAGFWDDYPHGLVTMNPDGSSRTGLCCSGDLPPSSGVGTANWSPDGGRLVFEHSGSGLEIVNRDGSGRTTLRSDNYYLGTGSDPAWSPDGQQVVFQRNSNIAVINADGTGETEIPGSGGNPDWQPIVHSYPRPKGATPLLASLVPAYAQCTSPNSTHNGPLDAGSCAPPSQSSGFLTPGYPENGAQAKMAGSLRLDVINGNPALPPDEGDVQLRVNVNDVRCQSTSVTAVCPNSNGEGRPTDYAGELQAALGIRITDKLNGAGTGSATVEDLTFPFNVACVDTAADQTSGSNCSVTTTADTVLPGAITEGKRSIWDLDQIRVFDGGPDGDAETSDNTLFLTQGIFVP